MHSRRVCMALGQANWAQGMILRGGRQSKRLVPTAAPWTRTPNSVLAPNGSGERAKQTDYHIWQPQMIQ